MKNQSGVKAALLLASMMTIMSGAIVSPTLPQISSVFKSMPHIDLLSRLVVTLPALFVALISPAIGRFIDKTGRKHLLLASLFLYAVSGVSGALLHNLHFILIGRALLGIAVGGIITISTTLVGDYFEGNERNRFMGLQGAFVGFGGVLLIGFAGILADIHWQAPFYIYLLAVPVFLLTWLFVWEPEKSQPPRLSAPRHDIGESESKKQIPLILITIFFGVVFFYMVPVQIPFMLQRLNGISNAMIGYAIALCTLTSSVVSTFYGLYRRRLSFQAIYGLSFALMGAGYITLSCCVSYSSYLLALALSGTGLGLFFPTGNLWIMEISSPHQRGRLMGRSSTAFFLGMFLSPIIVSPIAAQISDSLTFRLAGALLITSALFFFILSRKQPNITARTTMGQ